MTNYFYMPSFHFDNSLQNKILNLNHLQIHIIIYSNTYHNSLTITSKQNNDIVMLTRILYSRVTKHLYYITIMRYFF